MNTTRASADHAHDALTVARDFSRYVQRLLHADPDLAGRVAFGEPFTRECMTARLRTLRQDRELDVALRFLRQEVMLRLIGRDLSGSANLGEVVDTTSALAELAIEEVTAAAHATLIERYGEPIGEESGQPQRLHVVGMGKLGGRELNVSSDIDLILLYPEEGETNGARSTSNHEFFTRAARELTRVLDHVTEHGYVFRVDLRLRPYGDSGPTVSSFDMLENYLVTQGREWERYAWIKGRCLTGDRCAELHALVRPFVFRRHLDYSAFNSMRDLHHQVRVEVERRDIADNIKLGPGGIREIEFIVQVFQLIRGGRDTALQTQPTVQVLRLLTERRLIEPEAADELASAYEFLRNLEHRLQYLDDGQTHVLPRSAEDRERIAGSMGYASFSEMSVVLERHRERVSRHFHDIFVAAPGQTDDALSALWTAARIDGDSEHADALLTQLGYANCDAVQKRIANLRESSRFRQMPASSQAKLEQLVPRAIAVAAKQSRADATAERMLQLLESVGRRESYLALLEQYPQALARVAELMNASPWAAEYLTRHPILLDELLDTHTLYTAPDWSALAGSLRRQLDDVADDTEKEMDVLRHFKHVQTVHLLAQDLAGSLSLETLSDHLSDLACAILREVLRLAWKDVKQQHRTQPAFAIIGYGKLGGKELGYASDLDLVFLYDDDAPEAPENYSRLARRINNLLTTLTSAGVLYETDLRLRPDGVSGLLVSPLGSFREYQAKQAWPWEHQALTRARFVAGEVTVGAAFEAIRIATLRQPRDLAVFRQSVLDMRAKMLEAHPNASGRHDLKHDRGGIIDVEFIVQFLVLGQAHEHESLTGNIGNLALLKLAARLGLVSESAATGAHDAYRRFRQLQHSIRLQGEPYARVDAETVSSETAAVRTLWREVFAAD